MRTINKCILSGFTAVALTLGLAACQTKDMVTRYEMFDVVFELPEGWSGDGELHEWHDYASYQLEHRATKGDSWKKDGGLWVAQPVSSKMADTIDAGTAEELLETWLEDHPIPDMEIDYTHIGELKALNLKGEEDGQSYRMIVLARPTDILQFQMYMDVDQVELLDEDYHKLVKSIVSLNGDLDYPD